MAPVASSKQRLNYLVCVETRPNIFNRPLTEEEIRQILRERDERLDPANRPANSQVDNTPREWDYDHEDFADMVGRRPASDHGTWHGPAVERPAFLRTLGVALALVGCFFGWLTWAFFSKAFTEYDNVTLTTTKSGLALPRRADVKLRGMIVGVVRQTKVENGKVVLTLGMDPNLIDRVPADVRAEIIPKTLFGEKYVSLIPTGQGSTEHLKAGDTITDAKVPVEFEEFFNDVYPLLTAVPPDRVAYTLTALSDSLQGRGDSLGETLELSNAYLRKLNPDAQQAASDIIELGRVSGTYADSMSDVGKLLRNSSKVSRTVVDERRQLADVFDETDKLADVLRAFVDAAGEDLVATAHNNVGPLEVAARYATMFPCWFKGENALVDQVVNEVFGNNTLHIALPIANPQPSKYGQPGDPQPERPIIPSQAVLDSVGLTRPEIHGYDGIYPAGLGTICDELYAAAAGNPRTPDQPLPYPSAFWKAFGVRNTHNGKLAGTDADYNRARSSNSTDIDSPAQKDVLNRLVTALTGVESTNVPDVASILMSPVVRGAAIEVSPAASRRAPG